MGAPEWRIFAPSHRSPYANSWGLASTLLTPVMLACLLRAFHLAARCAAHRCMALSTVPAIATSKLRHVYWSALCAGFCCVVLAANWRVVAWGGCSDCGCHRGTFRLGLWTIFWAVRITLTRPWSRRSTVYLNATLESPDYRLGAHGTEHWCVDGYPGYLWTLMFCFGFCRSGTIRTSW